MGVFGGDWHSDFSFLEEPPMASILYSVEVPPVGGDTIWVNMARTYAWLPKETKTWLSGRQVIHTGKPYGVANAPDIDTQFTGSIKMDRCNPVADRETLHPAVCRHPDSGEPVLFISPTYTSRFDGETSEESEQMLKGLYAHCTRPEFSCRFRWTPRTVAIWDNRSTMHYAINDYDGYRRLMYRTTIRGARPQMYTGPSTNTAIS
jgi:taurine dioxygenase